MGNGYCPLAKGPRVSSEVITTNRRAASIKPWRSRGLTRSPGGVFSVSACLRFLEPGITTMRPVVPEVSAACKEEASDGVVTKMGSWADRTPNCPVVAPGCRAVILPGKAEVFLSCCPALVSGCGLDRAGRTPEMTLNCPVLVTGESVGRAGRTPDIALNCPVVVTRGSVNVSVPGKSSNSNCQVVATGRRADRAGITLEPVARGPVVFARYLPVRSSGTGAVDMTTGTTSIDGSSASSVS